MLQCVACVVSLLCLCFLCSICFASFLKVCQKEKVVNLCFSPPKGPQKVPPFSHFLSLCPPHTRPVGWCWNSAGSRIFLTFKKQFRISANFDAKSSKNVMNFFMNRHWISGLRQAGEGGGVYGVGDPDHF